MTYTLPFLFAYFPNQEAYFFFITIQHAKYLIILPVKFTHIVQYIRALDAAYFSFTIIQN